MKRTNKNYNQTDFTTQQYLWKSETVDLSPPDVKKNKRKTQIILLSIIAFFILFFILLIIILKYQSSSNKQNQEIVTEEETKTEKEIEADPIIQKIEELKQSLNQADPTKNQDSFPPVKIEVGFDEIK